MALDRDPLVSTAWLAKRLGEADVRPLDASWWFSHEKRDAAAEFEAAHIAGAAFFDIDGIADHATPLPHMLPSPTMFSEAVKALGISNASTVVIYETGAPRSAARAWWTFRAMGHHDVLVLDGGLQKWRSEGRLVQSGAAHPRPGGFTARFDPSLVRSAADIGAIIQTGGAQIADARPGARFRGEAPEPREGLKTGHMPGAFSLPASDLYAADGTMLANDVLAQKLAEVGIDPAKPVVASCGSGITACMIALALARLGHWDAAVYDGSWAQWGALPDAPIVTGA